MNKFLAAAALTLCATTANAQTVSLYGRIDAEVNYATNQATGFFDGNGRAITGGQWSVPGNMWGTSFVGIKGVEDLGGGLKAIFNLESGFATGKGAINGGVALWNRRSYIGLAGDCGTIKLGRDLTLPSDLTYSLDPTGQQAMGTATLAKGRNWPQTSNQIQYVSPNVNGFSAIGMYAFDEKSGTSGVTQNGKSRGVEVGYDRDGVAVKIMYDDAADSSGQFSSLFQYSKEFTVGGTLQLDKWKLFAGYQTQSAPDMAAGIGNPNRAQQVWLGAQYQITPMLVLIPAVFHSKLNQNTGGATLAMLGANYYLSKSTILFASVGTLKNSARSSFAIEVGNSAVGVNQSAFYTGISQSF